MELFGHEFTKNQILLIGVVLVLGLLFGFIAFLTSGDDDIKSSFQSKMGTMTEMQYKNYDDKYVLGSDVIQIIEEIKRQDDDFIVQVSTIRQSSIAKTEKIKISLFYNDDASSQIKGLIAEHDTFYNRSAADKDTNIVISSSGVLNKQYKSKNDVNYIPQGATFFARIVKNSTGEIVGYSFLQVHKRGQVDFT